MVVAPQSVQVLENTVQFSCSNFSQTETLPSRIPVFYMVVFLTYFTAVSVIIFIIITRVRIVKNLFEIIHYTFGF
jgi:hypothetical protein